MAKMPRGREANGFTLTEFQVSTKTQRYHLPQNRLICLPDLLLYLITGDSYLAAIWGFSEGFRYDFHILSITDQ